MKRKESFSTRDHSQKGGNAMTKLCMSLLLVMVMGISTEVFSQPPPPNGTGHGSTGNQQPGGPSAPVGNGTLILFVLAAAYAGKKVYKYQQENHLKQD